MKAIELFAGAGGAALGLEAAGVHHLALCEWNPDACATLRSAGLGPVVEGDVRDLDAIARTAFRSAPSAWNEAGELLLDSDLTEDAWMEAREDLTSELLNEDQKVDLLWSSYPCQAFSIAGKRLGAKDDRNGWPWTVAAIDRFQPRWFLGENVRGLLCHRADCDRTGPPEDCPGCYFHRVILEELRERFPVVGWWLLDAADYGVPQHRRRVICYAGEKPVTPPRATHGPGMFTRPWVSIGEALQLNGQRVIGGGSNPRGPNDPGGRTWRDITDEPSTTIAAIDIQANRNGPFILSPERRRLTLAESGTIQGFAENYPWQGTNKAQLRQIGNAVPPKLAQVVVEAILEADRKP